MMMNQGMGNNLMGNGNMGMDMNMMNPMAGMNGMDMNMMNPMAGMNGMDMNMMNPMAGMSGMNMNMMNPMAGMSGMNMNMMNPMAGMSGMNMMGMNMMNQDSVNIDDNKGWNLIFENQNDRQTYTIRISENKTVKEAISLYKIKSGRKDKMKFVFNNKELCSDLKICQSGLTNCSKILVISLQNLKGA